MFAFIVLNYLNYEDTISLLKTIHQNHWFPTVRIYVIDNDSPNDSVLHLESFIQTIGEVGNVRLIKSNRNDGFAAGENLGIRAALLDGAEYVVSVNSDVLVPPEPELLSHWVGIFERDKSIAVITPQVYSPDGFPQNPLMRYRPSKLFITILRGLVAAHIDRLYYFFRIYLLFFPMNFLGRVRYRLSKSIKPFIPASGYIYAAHGSLQVFTPSYFKVFDGHSEGLFMYFEEFIEAELLQSEGLKIFFDGSYSFFHGTSRSLVRAYSDDWRRRKFQLSCMLIGLRSYLRYYK